MNGAFASKSTTFNAAFASKPASSGFYKAPSSSWGSKPEKKPEKAEPKVDVKDYAAFPSLGSSTSLPPRASLRTSSKEAVAPPLPKLGAWTAVAAKPAAPPVVMPKLMPKPEVPAAAGGAGYQFPSYFGNGPNRIFSEEEAMMMEHCPPEEREGRLAWIMSMEDEDEEEEEFNAHLASNRRRGDKGVW